MLTEDIPGLRVVTLLEPFFTLMLLNKAPSHLHLELLLVGVVSCLDPLALLTALFPSLAFAL